MLDEEHETARAIHDGKSALCQWGEHMRKTMALPVKLTEEEIQQIAREAGAVQLRIEGEEDAAREDSRMHKDAIKELKTELSAKLGVLGVGTAVREVEVYEETDYTAGEVRTYRADTGALVLRRTMTELERQRELDFGKPEEPKPEEPKAAEEPATPTPRALVAEELPEEDVIKVAECIDVTPRALVAEELDPPELDEETAAELDEEAAAEESKRPATKKSKKSKKSKK